MKKQLALFLALLMMGSSFAACGSAETGTETTANPAAGEETTAEETVDPLADNLPEADYGGYKFRITTWYDKVGLEESTGEVLNDAIFCRDLAVEERYNIDIVSEFVPQRRLCRMYRSHQTVCDRRFQRLGRRVPAHGQCFQCRAGRDFL